MKISAPHLFQCKYCGQIVKSIISPSSLKCDVDLYHSWGDLGLEGDTFYECKKCDTLVNLSAVPSFLNCPARNNHTWKKVACSDLTLPF